VPRIEAEFVSTADRPELVDRCDGIAGASYPEFMYHDPRTRYFSELYTTHLAFQFVLVDSATGEVAAFGNSIAARYDGALDELPEEGWDWAIEKGVADHRGGARSNVLFGLQVVVAPGHRGKGLSSLCVAHMVEMARGLGLADMIVPVRPTAKSHHPVVPMEVYVTWRDNSGEHFDPWLRVHERLGGRIVKVCRSSMTISGTVEDWRRWTGMDFAESGPHVVPGALVPVEIDLEKDRGVYIEPNVWMHHPVR
jgi:GNAT superfamily N-acetyltransferase